MSGKYTTPDMTEIFSNGYKYHLWAKVEWALYDAMAQRLEIDEDEYGYVKDHLLGLPWGGAEVGQVAQQEVITKHEMTAFLKYISQPNPIRFRYVHYGATSSDIMDTALSLQIKEAGEIIGQEMQYLRDVIRKLRDAHQDTPMVGRTHGKHAEPMTFGHKLAGWWMSLWWSQEAFSHALDRARVGKLSGALGDHKYITEEEEAKALGSLGLLPMVYSAQHIDRDKYAAVLNSMAVMGSVMERIAIGLRLMARTESGEIDESYTAWQDGSSAMPHKRNPIRLERISGLARLLRADAQVGMDNIALWDERDISNSSAERETIERAFNVCHFMIADLAQTIKTLRVNTQAMSDNMIWQKIDSEEKMLEKIRKGMSRSAAYAATKWEETHPYTPPGDAED